MKENKTFYPMLQVGVVDVKSRETGNRDGEKMGEKREPPLFSVARKTMPTSQIGVTPGQTREKRRLGQGESMGKNNNGGEGEEGFGEK